MKKLGILGGGQLGLMLALDARRMGIPTIVVDQNKDCPASACAKVIVGKITNREDVLYLSEKCDVMTIETENCDTAALRGLADEGFPVHPAPATLEFIRDKYVQHNVWHECGLPTPRIMAIKTTDDPEVVINATSGKWGCPVMLKTRFGGFDGRGTTLIRDSSDIGPALEKFSGQPVYLEEWMQISRELAVVMYRDATGEVGHYPVIQTFQARGICEAAMMLLEEDPITGDAIDLGYKVMEHLQGCGVFTVEMFEDQYGHLSINEVAPRVHNSGHLTVEGCRTSQFEQHVRCVMGLRPGAPFRIAQGVAMTNILGRRNGPALLVGVEEALKKQCVSVTPYGKAETQVDRKMGHIVCAMHADPEFVLQRVREARELISI